MTDLPIEVFPDAEAEASAEPPALATTDRPWDADPADLADQLAEVPVDDDRY